MKYYILFFLLLPLGLKAQITYTPLNAAGYQIKYLKVDSGFALPVADTTLMRNVIRPGLMVINTLDSLPYYYSGTKWKPVYVDSAGVIGLINKKVDSVTINGSTMFYWIAGLGYGTTINKIDSVTQSHDSVFTWINGHSTYSFLLTSGSGTVTQVIGGYGLVSDTITSNGILLVDTSVIAAKSWSTAQFAPISHTHSASDIISGTLPIARGGTGMSGIGAVGQLIRVAASGTALEYFSPDYYNSATSLDSSMYSLNKVNGDKTVFVFDGEASAITSIVAGTGITIDNTNPSAPIINAVNTALWHSSTNKANEIYYSNHVGIGTDTAYSNFQVMFPNIGANPADSNAIILANPTSATSGAQSQISPSVLYITNGWNSNNNTSFTGRVRTYAAAPSQYAGSQYTYPTYYIQGSIDNGATYVTYGYFQNTLSGLQFHTGDLNANNVNFVNSSIQSALSVGNTATTYYGVTNLTQNIGTSTSDSATILNVVSTTRGLLPPRMTSGQRDSINMYISSVTITNAGTGYTSPPTVSFSINASPVSFSTSSSATGTAVLSGGGVVSVTITNSGYYNSGTVPTISFSGGGGTGAAGTCVLTQRPLPAGLTIYCTNCTATDASTGVMQTYNGTTWKNNW